MTDTASTHRELRADGTGRLKIFLGFAPGAGKTFAMLDESTRRKKRGADIVTCLVDSGKRPATAEVLSNFEQIPSLTLPDGSQTLDTEAIIKRNPDVVLIDNLSKANPPGAPREKRYEDVLAILKAGICVLATLDVQNLESLNDQVEDITGNRPTETLPDQIFQTADEVEMVDVTPRAVIHRLERGDIFPDPAMAKQYGAWMTEANLSTLREMAFREISERVDSETEEHHNREFKVDRPFSTHDRVMICLTPTRPSMRMIRRGWRIAHRMSADALCVIVEDHEFGDKERKILKDDYALAKKLDIKVVELKGSVGQQLIDYAKKYAVTHIVIGHSDRSKFKELTKGSIISTLTRELKTVDIIVVANEVD